MLLRLDGIGRRHRALEAVKCSYWPKESQNLVFFCRK